MKFSFNQRQKKALAQSFDNIAVAITIAILIGAFVNDSKLTLVNGIALGIVSVLFFGYAAFLRRGDKSDDGCD